MLGGYFIWYLPRLREVTIPGTVGKIEDYRLCDGNIESVTVPASVGEIGENTFRNCRKLKRVVF